MSFLGIYREPEFSPGRHMNNDALILRLTAQALERYGEKVRLATLEEARSLWKSADLVFSMCQGPRAIAELEEWKKDGAFIFNDPAASRRTYRDSLCSTLREKELGFPHSFFVSTDANADLSVCEPLFEKGGAWVKRPDVHATQTGDVVRAASWAELRPALAQFQNRGLSTAVVQQHCEGDEVKFYSVRGRLFWPYYPRESQGYPFDERELRLLAEHAARTLDLGIYGGDAIIGPDGDITLIDLNDWPSFAPCRGAAASAIAYYLKDAYHAHKNQRTATIV